MPVADNSFDFRLSDKWRIWIVFLILLSLEKGGCAFVDEVQVLDPKTIFQHWRWCRWISNPLFSRLRFSSNMYCEFCLRGNNVKLVMHQISVDKIENPCYWINRCTFDMVLPSILSTQYWESLIFSPCIVIGEIKHFCVPRGQRRFFIKIEAKASICSWEVCFCCCTH